MSIASSSTFSCIKHGIYIPQSSSFSTSKCTSFTIRCSQVDGSNLRKPLAPSPPTPPTPLKPVPPTPPSSSSPPPLTPPAKTAAVVVEEEEEEGKKGRIITLEFQRKKAKELQEYFKQKKLDEADQGPFFGFIAKNEISNGRWAMFGFAVGMLTEYATGSDFVHQLQILLSNFGILDLE